MSSSSALWLLLLWGKLIAPVNVTFFSFLITASFFIKDKTKIKLRVPHISTN